MACLFFVGIVMIIPAVGMVFLGVFGDLHVAESALPDPKDLLLMMKWVVIAGMLASQALALTSLWQGSKRG